jgi:hypothetical protein
MPLAPATQAAATRAVNASANGPSTGFATSGAMTDLPLRASAGTVAAAVARRAVASAGVDASTAGRPATLARSADAPPSAQPGTAAGVTAPSHPIERPGVSAAQTAEQVMGRIARQIAIERERRGGGTWP